MKSILNNKVCDRKKFNRTSIDNNHNRAIAGCDYNFQWYKNTHQQKEPSAEGTVRAAWVYDGYKGNVPNPWIGLRSYLRDGRVALRHFTKLVKVLERDLHNYILSVWIQNS